LLIVIENNEAGKKAKEFKRAPVAAVRQQLILAKGSRLHGV
jgi:hypothetical protein